MAISIISILRTCRFRNFQPLPAPGFRLKNSGELCVVGNNGYSWSSAVSGTDGVNMGFHVTVLYSSLSDNRAYGFQLRCLSE
ncbi:hypothetical protein [uncultured Rikenella sp.]|uniref:hypothetical protein n=1 Tax=uncultured Rikenella sp. TaxID=368003 RepID=UPI00261B5DFF|nr:hypothetical protein [uncultured Rikenella sp.]